MEWGMKFNSIKKDILKNKRSVESLKPTEGFWEYTNSPIDYMGKTFSQALPKEYSSLFKKGIYYNPNDSGEIFKRYIENTLVQNPKEGRVAIEFGGQGSKLFGGFSDGFFKKTIGVCLKDVRRERSKEEDEKNGHSVVAGDIMNTSRGSVYEEISNKLGDSKTDLIISRMMGPLGEIGKDPFILNRIINKWYGMLKENGLIFVQFEYFDEHNHDFMDSGKSSPVGHPENLTKTEQYVAEWANNIKEKFPNEIEIQINRGILRLHKKSGAPEDLSKMQ